MVYFLSEKPCHYPDDSIPVIANGTLEINGHRVHAGVKMSDVPDDDDDEKAAAAAGNGGVGVGGVGNDDSVVSVVSSGTYKPGAVAIYRCRPGFLLVPLSAGKRVCHRGKWEGNMPACSEDP